MTHITELDIFYISYDEPNAEDHFYKNNLIFPFIKRVHGIKGFDAAHKECAKNSDTNFFITIDGDNIVDKKFFDIEIDLKNNTVYSWNSKNMVNGLVYGNGGLKVWPKDMVLNMNTHENSNDNKSSIEFCWALDYIQMNNVYSYCYPNGSPLQAFRAGFREGVKMNIHMGDRIPKEDYFNQVRKQNYQRFLIWATVGADVENGIWAILGARLGAYKVFCDKNFDITNIRDFDYFSNEIKKYDPNLIHNEIKTLGDILRKQVGFHLVELDKNQSEFFKITYTDPLYLTPSTTEKEVMRR